MQDDQVFFGGGTEAAEAAPGAMESALGFKFSGGDVFGRFPHLGAGLCNIGVGALGDGETSIG